MLGKGKSHTRIEHLGEMQQPNQEPKGTYTHMYVQDNNYRQPTLNQH